MSEQTKLSSEVEDLLKEWSKIKRQRAILEEQEDNIKELVAELMDKNSNRNKKGADILESENYYVTRRTQKRSTISQKDVPRDIWDKYSKTSEYKVYTLKRV